MDLRISVAIPIFNEEQTIAPLLRRTLAVLDALEGGPHEVVLVDDGSTDASATNIESFISEDVRVRLVQLSRNFGHQAALTAALDHAIGDAVFLMDGDLQDAPEELPRFLERFADGF